MKSDPTEPRTKIVCTVGPACEDAATLEAMVRAGADVFRLNGAHVPADRIAGWVQRVRAAGEAAGLHPAVLMDLPGTKIRVGPMPDGPRVLAPGAGVRLVDGAGAPRPGEVPVPIPWFASVPPGTEVLLKDGQIRLEVLQGGEHALPCRVADGGEVRPGMGVHFRGVALPTSVPTDGDRRLVEAAVAAGVDAVSQSFVRSAEEMTSLRRLLDSLRARGTFTVAKIERLDAVEALEGILAACDGVMVARGDLGVDALPERVPSLQLRILEAGARAGRPVIVATEMLESMVASPRPTRAEATDVAAAVLMGADAVMLSAETATGAHPVLVVQTMARILAAVERDPMAPYAGSGRMRGPTVHRGRPDEHVVRAAVSLAHDTRAAAIVVFTRTGASAVRLSKERPEAPIHAFAPTDAVCRRLALAWGVRAHRVPPGTTTDATLAEVESRLRERLPGGSRAVLVMGGAADPAGATTLVKLLTL